MKMNGNGPLALPFPFTEDRGCLVGKESDHLGKTARPAVASNPKHLDRAVGPNADGEAESERVVYQQTRVAGTVNLPGFARACANMAR
jgi:hypothetical protein